MTEKPKHKSGRPPADTRFQPGQSGNPKGRPKGRVSFETLIERELRKSVVITENGRSRRMTKKEVIIRRLTHESIRGEYRAIELLLKLVGPGREKEVEASAEDFSMPDKDTLRIIARRLKSIISEK